jgi:toxin CcdB
MTQFAAHRNPNPATRSAVPFLLDVQSDLLEDLVTRVVIPLYEPAAIKGGIIERLMPCVEIDGAPYIAVTLELAGIPRKLLGAPVADLAIHRQDVVAALDFLITGL